MLAYEHNIRAELSADDRAGGGHGWFTVAAVNHSKHEVAAQGKSVMRAALAASAPPGSDEWQNLTCDVMHQPLPGGDCAPDVEPGLAGGVDGYVPLCPGPGQPCTCTAAPEFPCLNNDDAKKKESGKGLTAGKRQNALVQAVMDAEKRILDLESQDKKLHDAADEGPLMEA